MSSGIDPNSSVSLIRKVTCSADVNTKVYIMLRNMDNRVVFLFHFL